MIFPTEQQIGDYSQSGGWQANHLTLFQRAGITHHCFEIPTYVGPSTEPVVGPVPLSAPESRHPGMSVLLSLCTSDHTQRLENSDESILSILWSLQRAHWISQFLAAPTRRRSGWWGEERGRGSWHPSSLRTSAEGREPPSLSCSRSPGNGSESWEDKIISDYSHLTTDYSHLTHLTTDSSHLTHLTTDYSHLTHLTTDYSHLTHLTTDLHILGRRWASVRSVRALGQCEGSTHSSHSPQPGTGLILFDDLIERTHVNPRPAPRWGRSRPGWCGGERWGKLSASCLCVQELRSVGWDTAL